MAEALSPLRLSDGACRARHLDLGEADLPSAAKVSENIRHRVLRFDVASPLDLRYAGRADVLVASDLFVHHARPGEEPKAVSPDLFVAFGVGPRTNRFQRSFVVWEEGTAPDFVLEILSDSTRRNDVERKPEEYRSMGVREYFLFDPTERLQPSLQGHALRRGRYRRQLPDGGMGLDSEVLGLRLCVVGAERDLRWYDPEAREYLRTLKEAEALAAAQATARKAAENRATVEAEARTAAEAEIARLREQVRWLQDAQRGR